MKSPKSFIAFAIISLFTASFAFAADGKTEAKVAGCCAKAKADEKTCSHACCVEATKAGKNCTKCGGAGDVADVKEKKAKKKKKDQ